jgi:hypothetical protein
MPERAIGANEDIFITSTTPVLSNPINVKSLLWLTAKPELSFTRGSRAARRFP